MYIGIRKKQTYDYLIKYCKKNKKAPFLIEIGQNAYGKDKLCEERVRQIVLELEKDGKVKIEKGKERKIKIISNENRNGGEK